jgi:hypothetical protein
MPIGNFTFFEPCIVIYICNKNQLNAHFFINDLIHLYCLRHASNKEVFILRKTCTCSLMAFFTHPYKQSRLMSGCVSIWNTSYWTQSNIDMSYSPCDPARVYAQATLNHLSHVPPIWSFDLPLHDPCISRVTEVHRICLPICMHQRVPGLSFLSLLFCLGKKRTK